MRYRRRLLRLGRRSRRQRLERRTVALGVLGLSTAGAVAAGEIARVWRRGSAPLPNDAEHVLEAGAEAAMETVAVVRQGYRRTSARESALLNLLGSFTISFGIVRLTTMMIRRRGQLGPFRNMMVGERHIHHFVPGILLAFLAGGASVLSRDEDLDKWFAIPFGTGVALTLDESALLLRLDDVYWTEEGILSIEVTFATIALLSSVALALRLLQRGEAAVLGPDAVAQAGAESVEPRGLHAA